MNCIFFMLWNIAHCATGWVDDDAVEYVRVPVHGPAASLLNLHSSMPSGRVEDAYVEVVRCKVPFSTHMNRLNSLAYKLTTGDCGIPGGGAVAGAVAGAVVGAAIQWGRHRAPGLAPDACAGVAVGTPFDESSVK